MSNPDRGRPFSDVWEYMIKGQQQSRGHYTATCTYCNCTWKHGKPCVLRQHLANHCKNCPQDVALYFARIVGQKMGEDEDDENDTFVMCNIPFSTIENLWFVDLMKTLQPGYDLPSRHTLSGTYLEAELSRVNIRIVNELNNESNLTIALDGWTDPRGNSLWAFMLLTGSRKEYLWSLEDLSSTKHTGQHIANVIDEVLDNHEISSDNVKSILKK
ncbi:unnamed protein product [Rhizophagus irregularis]|nr:unnamed protein product [Rhizophagus irregularis]